MTYCYPFRRGIGRKSQRFGANPNNGVNPAGGHTGDDWAVDEGTPIHAAGDGVIELSGWPTANYLDSAYWLTSAAGDALVLNCGDDGPSFIYGHNSHTPLPVGTVVRKGDVIGLTGNSGLSTGPHCHVEVLPPGFVVNSPTYGRVDPETYFDEYVDDLPATTETEDDMAITQDDANLIAQTILGAKWQGAPNAVLGELLNEYRAQHLTLVKVVAEALGIDESKLVDQLLNQGEVTISKR